MKNDLDKPQLSKVFSNHLLQVLLLNFPKVIFSLCQLEEVAADVDGERHVDEHLKSPEHVRVRRKHKPAIKHISQKWIQKDYIIPCCSAWFWEGV